MARYPRKDPKAGGEHFLKYVHPMATILFTEERYWGEAQRRGGEREEHKALLELTVNDIVKNLKAFSTLKETREVFYETSTAWYKFREGNQGEIWILRVAMGDPREYSLTWAHRLSLAPIGKDFLNANKAKWWPLTNSTRSGQMDGG